MGSPSEAELLAGGRGGGYHHAQLNLGFLNSFDREKLTVEKFTYVTVTGWYTQNLPVWCANSTVFL